MHNNCFTTKVERKRLRQKQSQHQLQQGIDSYSRSRFLRFKLQSGAQMSANQASAESRLDTHGLGRRITMIRPILPVDGVADENGIGSIRQDTASSANGQE